MSISRSFASIFAFAYLVTGAASIAGEPTGFFGFSINVDADGIFDPIVKSVKVTGVTTLVAVAKSPGT